MKKFILLVVVLLLLASLDKKENPMSTEFTGVNGQEISYGTTVLNTTTKTIMGWMKFTGATGTSNTGIIGRLVSSDNTDGWWFRRETVSGSTKLRLIQQTTGTLGSWSTNSGAASVGTIFHFALTYNSSSVSNDPIFYIDGVAVSSTEDVTPTGTIKNSAPNNLHLGDMLSVGTVNSVEAVFYSITGYDRILSADEIATAYASRLAIPDYRGLVFAPQVWAGNTEGGTITTNIINTVDGEAGTPAGNPVFSQDTYLTFK